MRINLIPMAGRVGTSTIAVCLAKRLLERTNSTVEILTANQQEVRELMWSIGEGTTAHLNEVGQFKSSFNTFAGFDIAIPAASMADYSIKIYDKGEKLKSRTPRQYTLNIALVNTTYNSLASITHNQGEEFDGYVVNQIEGTALTMNDVATVIQKPQIATWIYDLAVQRTLDAGLLVSRLDRLDDVVNSILEFAFAKVTQGNEQENIK
jgi:hypothetical protein